jgi:hypothetical protein
MAMTECLTLFLHITVTDSATFLNLYRGATTKEETKVSPELDSVGRVGRSLTYWISISGFRSMQPVVPAPSLTSGIGLGQCCRSFGSLPYFWDNHLFWICVFCGDVIYW